MPLFSAFILGVIQGLTEFLPVSSSGHLVLGQWLLGVAEHDLLFDLAAHVGTLLAIVTVYKERFCTMLCGVFCSIKQKRMLEGGQFFLWVLVASLPTAAVGLWLEPYFAALFSSLLAVGVGFLFTGTLIGCTMRLKPRAQPQAMQGGGLSYLRAFLIGVAQSVAIAPGVSRSGTTIATALLLGVNKERAGFFSFSICVPAILGGAALKLLLVPEWSIDVIGPLLVGALTAYVFGLLGLRLVLHFVLSDRFGYFSFYLWPLGVGTIVAGFLLH